MQHEALDECRVHLSTKHPENLSSELTYANLVLYPTQRGDLQELCMQVRVHLLEHHCKYCESRSRRLALVDVLRGKISHWQ